jgi:ABC-type multidrug transport system ATPase subunit
MNPVELDDLEKAYGSVRALKGVSATFEPGTVHAVIGPNGSGKTTLFRILLGLTSPSSGSVSLPDVTLGCGFQQPQFYPGLTVGENLRTFGSLAGAENAWVETLIERCGLGRLENRLAGDLSDGLAKKLDFALAFIDQPDVVVLDEPFADVDDESKPRLLAFLDSYVTGDRLLLVTSHQLSLFREILDAMTVLYRGEVVLDERLENIDDLGERGLTEIYVDLIG